MSDWYIENLKYYVFTYLTYSTPFNNVTLKTELRSSNKVRAIHNPVIKSNEYEFMSPLLLKSKLFENI